MKVVGWSLKLLFVGMTLALGAIACGDDEGGEGATVNAVVTDCQAGCARGKSLECGQDSSAICNQLCAAFGGAAGACRDKAATYFACAKDGEYECGALGGALKEGECKAEQDAYMAACASM